MTSQVQSTIAVVGGGLVGASLALALARQGFDVTLVDRARPQRNCGALGIDIRNVALSPASQALLSEIDVWSGVQSVAYDRMCVWEQWGHSQVEFSAEEVGRTELGWLVELSPLVCAAWAQIEAQPSNIEILLAEIDDVVPAADRVTLQLSDGGQRQFDFLIAADGAQSIVRRALSVPVVKQTLDQVAIATVVQTQHSHEFTAWQRFLVDGPLAFLPSVHEHLCSVVWSQSQANAKRRLALDDAQFAKEIEFAFEARLGEVTAVDQRVSFPLMQQRVKDCAPHGRILLVGDALRVVHPLAGQGVNLGLEDVSAVLAVTAHQADLSVPGLWNKYARQRQARSAFMMQIMRSLQKLYGSDSPMLSLLRNLGVASFNVLPSIKHQVMREAMGLGE